MYQFSDSDSKDSDDGIRFKTESTRNKESNKRKEHSRRKRSRSKSRSPKHRRKHSSRDISKKKEKHRSDSKKYYKNNSSEDEEYQKYKKSRSKNSESNLSESSKTNTKHSVVTRDISSITRNIDDIPLGPSLPPHLKRIKSENSIAEKINVPEIKLTELPMPADISKNIAILPEKLDICGPELPADILAKKVQNSSTTADLAANNEQTLSVTNSLEFAADLSSKTSATTLEIGPTLPPHLQSINIPLLNIGPKLPQHLQDEQINSDILGPALPLHLINTIEENKKVDIEETCENQNVIVGPALPPHLRKQLAEKSSDSDHIVSEELEELDDVYGPLPVGDMNYNSAQIALEERALQIKMDQLNPDSKNEPTREEWMLELPSAKARNLGLGPRQFRSKAGPDLSDRSSWTDTPEEKAKKKKGIVTEKKVDIRKEAELRELEKRDKSQEEVIKKHKKKNKDSLLEIHQNKLKEKKGEQGPSERKPFNRETDLQVNRFDEAQKKAVLKKAQLLDDRFSRGQSKFL